MVAGDDAKKANKAVDTGVIIKAGKSLMVFFLDPWGRKKNVEVSPVRSLAVKEVLRLIRRGHVPV